MPLVVAAVREDDLLRYAQVYEAAFSPESGPAISAVITPPSARTPENEAAAVQETLARAQKRFKSSTVFFREVTDTDTNEIIAFARWKIYHEERTWDQVMEDTKQSPPPKGVNEKAWNAIFGYIQDARREFMGTRPHYCASVSISR